MMKKSTKIFMTGAASLLGVALATGGAYATTGSLTTVDTPGKVMHVSGVGPASKHASATALTHANPNAKGLFGWSESTEAPVVVAPDPVVPDDAIEVEPVKPVKEDTATVKPVKDKPVKIKPVKVDKAHQDKAGKHENCSKNRHSGWANDDKAGHDHKKFHKADHKKAHHVEPVAAGDAVEVTKHVKRSHQGDSRHHSSRSHDRDGSRDGSRDGNRDGGDRHRGGRDGGHHSGGSRG